MPPREITADEVAFYQEHGYVIIRNFLTGADEIEHWRDAVMTAARERGPWRGGGAITLPTAITHPTLRGHPRAARHASRANHTDQCTVAQV